MFPYQDISRKIDLANLAMESIVEMAGIFGVLGIIETVGMVGKDEI